MGYRVHFSETCDQDVPEFITNVHLTSAPISDVVAIPTIHAQMKERGFVPTQHLMDGGYLSSELLVAHQNSEIQLIGPVKRSSIWQRKTPDAFTHDDFQIDWANHDVKCPQGHLNSSWVEGVTKDGTPIITVKFRKRGCAHCPVRARCTRADPAKGGRTIAFRHEEQYRALNSARHEQNNRNWLKTYQLRAGVEGTMSQAIRRFALR